MNCWQIIRPQINFVQWISNTGNGSFVFFSNFFVNEDEKNSYLNILTEKSNTFYAQESYDFLLLFIKWLSNLEVMLNENETLWNQCLNNLVS